MLFEVFLGTSLYTGYGLYKFYDDKLKLQRGQTLSDGERLEPHDGYQTMIQILKTEKEIEMPMYINTGTTGLSIPLGGGTVERDKILVEKLVHATDETKSKYAQLADFRYGTPKLTQIGFMNTQEQLDLPAKFPLYHKSLFLKDKVYMPTRWQIAGTNIEQVAAMTAKARHHNMTRIIAAGFVAAVSGAMFYVDPYSRREVKERYSIK
jgi:hypothetical protein